MSLIRNFLSGFDLYLVPAAVICITIHECAHGYAAFKLGDPTARMSGRLTLNPIRHIDPIGFILLIIAGFGWAKPVPVDSRYFKKPRRDMAVTALAGPVSNFVLSFLLLIILVVIYRFAPYNTFTNIMFNFLLKTAMLSIGLGVFNLLPVSPLDGSKILFSFLPDRIYYTILRYERYGSILLIALIYLGWLNGVLSSVQSWMFEALIRAADLPFTIFQ